VWALPAAAERYVFGPPDTLSSSAGSTSWTVASLAMISSRRPSLYSPSPRGPVGRQAFNLTGGQFEVGDAA
jgi:hypothetical protein